MGIQYTYHFLKIILKATARIDFDSRTSFEGNRYVLKLKNQLLFETGVAKNLTEKELEVLRFEAEKPN